MDYLSFVLCLLLSWAAIHFLLSNVRKSRESNPWNLPPGPPTLPIFGNLFNLGAKPHVSSAELAKSYGPLMTLQLGQVMTEIVSSAVTAKEALQKNDLYLSNRSVIDAVRAPDHHHSPIIWLSLSPLWRNLRKITNSEVFSAYKLDKSQGLRREKVRDLLDYVRRQSEAGLAVDIGQVAFTTSLNLLSNSFFSMDLGDPKSECACEFRDTTRGIMEELGKPNFADYFPILKKIDPQGIRWRTSLHFGKLIDFFNIIIDQRLQGKRLPGSTVQGDDVLDTLLGISQEKSEELPLSTIPHLLMVITYSYSFKVFAEHVPLRYTYGGEIWDHIRKSSATSCSSNASHLNFFKNLGSAWILRISFTLQFECDNLIVS